VEITIQAVTLEIGAFCQLPHSRRLSPVNLDVFGDRGNTAITMRVNGDEEALVCKKLRNL
jgi:hypothetical protein